LRRVQAMAVYTDRLPERKASKRSAITWEPFDADAGPAAGQLLIDTDRSRTAYLVSEFPTGWPGRGFHFKKLTAGTDPESESYSVFCSARGPAGDTCECKGFTFKGHCKHADAIRAMVGNGWI
jgi:hypothetical protein